MSNTTSPTRAELIAWCARNAESYIATERKRGSNAQPVRWNALIAILESEPDLTMFEDAAIGGTTVQSTPAAPSPGDALRQQIQKLDPNRGRGPHPQSQWTSGYAEAIKDVLALLSRGEANERL